MKKVIEKRCEASLRKSFKPIGHIVKYKKCMFVGMCVLQKPSQDFGSTGALWPTSGVIQTKSHFDQVIVKFF